MSARTDISVRPVGTLHPTWATWPLPADFEAAAEIVCGGLLIRHRQTGHLAEWTGQAIASVDPRKARAALDALKAART